jgi:hypothetical protein
MLLIGQDNPVTFRVTVAGTSEEPAVRLRLGGEPALSFSARRAEGDQWEANLALPAATPPGPMDLAVEVTLGGRLLVPLRRSIDAGTLEVTEPVRANRAPEPEPAPGATVATSAPAEPRVISLADLAAAADPELEPAPPAAAELSSLLAAQVAALGARRPAAPSVTVAPPRAASAMEALAHRAPRPAAPPPPAALVEAADLVYL